MDNNSALIISAAKRPSIRSMDKSDKLVLMAAIVAKTFSAKGLQSNAKDNVEIAENLNERLMEVLPSITVEEIQIACRKGVYGEYGEYYGVNAVSIAGWCEAYYYSDEREHAIRVERQRETIPAERLLTAPDAEYHVRRIVKTLWEDCSVRGRFLSPLLTPKVKAYDYLAGKGIIPDAERKLREMMGRMEGTEAKEASAYSKMLGESQDLLNRAKANVLYLELKSMKDCPV